MDAETLKTVGQVAGIGGIALAVLLTIFREVIRKSIFPKLDSDAGYRLLRLILVLTWSVAIAGVGAWLMAKQWERPAAPVRERVTFKLTGLITDEQGNGVAGANVSVVGSGSFARSDSDGVFSSTSVLDADETDDDQELIVRITRDGFRPMTERVQLGAKNLVVKMDRMDAPRTLSTTAETAPIQRAADIDVPNVEHRDVPLPVQPVRGTIAVRYTGDVSVCQLGLTWTVGDQRFQPIANPYYVSGVALGQSQYNVVGGISCPTPGGDAGCIASGRGALELRNGATYDIVWQRTANFAQCAVVLMPAG